jgi:hypothetical protein
MEEKFASLGIHELVHAYNILYKLALSFKFSEEELKMYYNEYSTLTCIESTKFQIIEIWSMQSLLLHEIKQRVKQEKITIAQIEPLGGVPYLYMWNYKTE